MDFETLLRIVFGTMAILFAINEIYSGRRLDHKHPRNERKSAK